MARGYPYLPLASFVQQPRHSFWPFIPFVKQRDSSGDEWAFAGACGQGHAFNTEPWAASKC